MKFLLTAAVTEIHEVVRLRVESGKKKVAFCPRPDETCLMCQEYCTRVPGGPRVRYGCPRAPVARSAPAASSGRSSRVSYDSHVRIYTHIYLKGQILYIIHIRTRLLSRLGCSKIRKSAIIFFWIIKNYLFVKFWKDLDEISSNLQEYIFFISELKFNFGHSEIVIFWKK